VAAAQGRRAARREGKDGDEGARGAARAWRWRAASGGVTAAREFTASGVACGIKKQGLDLAVVYSTRPSTGAAVFTQNRVQAAPVRVSRRHLEHSGGRVRAVLINSGCANACTGARGARDAVASVRALGRLLGIDPYSILVGSTGVIGARLPVRKLLAGLPAAVAGLGPAGGDAALRAIMTTDTREKSAAAEARVGGGVVRIGGMVKGAGMIQPRMATMLSVVTTDADVPPALLDRLLRRVVERTYNCLTVDGDTSTNDMVVLVANGASGVRIDRGSAADFERGLETVCGELARAVARDGEGATKFLEIVVRGAPSFEAARTAAKAIANSPLVKTAFYGQELNWGRILCAAGYSGVPFDPERASLAIGGFTVYRRGSDVPRSRARAEAALERPEIRVDLDLGGGAGGATVWTCDLSHGYVDINGSYIS
jgi:glutamate N-acetyltransferase/amino-acid N-acetyltransferase